MNISRCTFSLSLTLAKVCGIHVAIRFAASIMLRIGYGHRVDTIDDSLLAVINEAIAASAINTTMIDIFPIREFFLRLQDSDILNMYLSSAILA